MLEEVPGYRDLFFFRPLEKHYKTKEKKMPARRRQQENKRDLDRKVKRLARERQEADAIWNADPLSDQFWPPEPCCDGGDGWNCAGEHGLA